MLVTPSAIVMLVRLLQYVEGTIPDAGDAITNRDARQVVSLKRPDAGTLQG